LEEKVKLIKDPIHGYIQINEEERRIIDSAPFQRLRRICQLPFANLVYPGANHTRFSHSLGCFYIAGEIVEKLKLEEYNKKVVKIAALLHDIGHPPFSHLCEQFLFEYKTNHEEMTKKIISENEELASAIEKSGINIKDVIAILEGKKPESSIVTGPIDSDKLDFLIRDSYYTGASYGIIDIKRLIHMMKLIGNKIAINIRALGVVEEFALARLQSFINIYYHHAVRAAQLLFVSAIKKEGIKNLLSLEIEDYLNEDDYTLWCKLKNSKKALPYIKRIEKRLLPKMAFETHLSAEKFSFSMLNEEDVRKQIERKIANIAGIDEEKIWIDTPYIAPIPLSLSHETPFYKEEDGEVKIVEVKSPFFEPFAQIYNILRIYTENEYRSQVEKAAKKFFEPLPEIERISL
jgi:HD superfamily phosphohydrolase